VITVLGVVTVARVVTRTSGASETLIMRRDMNIQVRRFMTFENQVQMTQTYRTGISRPTRDVACR